MTNLKKFIVLLGVIVGIMVVFAVVTIIRGDYSDFPKVFYEYQKKGKTTQFNAEDVRKGFQK